MWRSLGKDETAQTLAPQLMCMCLDYQHRRWGGHGQGSHTSEERAGGVSGAGALIARKRR